MKKLRSDLKEYVKPISLKNDSYRFRTFARMECCLLPSPGKVVKRASVDKFTTNGAHRSLFAQAGFCVADLDDNFKDVIRKAMPVLFGELIPASNLHNGAELLNAFHVSPFPISAEESTHSKATDCRRTWHSSRVARYQRHSRSLR